VAIITGTEFNDLLNGTSGADQIFGLAGTDFIKGGGGADAIDGGGGADTVKYGDSTVGVQVNLLLGFGRFGTAEGDGYVNVENVTGSNHDDVLTGNGGVNELQGGAGDDSINGGGDDDRLSGGIGNDTLNGGLGADRMEGGTGDDTLNGGLGDDWMEGGTGDDVYVVDSYSDLTAENAGEGIDEVRVTLNYQLRDNIERLVLLETAGAIAGIGNAVDNVLIGNSLSNSLRGGGGNDTMIGGAGSDTFFVDSIEDVVVEDPGGGINDTVFASISFTLAPNVERLQLDSSAAAIAATGNELNNDIFGNEFDNLLDGRGGLDSMVGGAGNDTYRLGTAGDEILELVNEGFDIAEVAFSGYTLAANVERGVVTTSAATVLTGNSLANELIGNAGNDTLSGLGGADLLDGGAGADTMSGGSGDDVFIVDNAADVVVEQGGLDEVRSSVSFALASATGQVENLTLLGSAAIDGTGNALANVLRGNGAANILDGGGGVDTLEGGLGDDTYRIDSALEQVIEAAGSGQDRAEVSFSGYTLAGNVEIGVMGLVAGGALNGNAADNILFGNVGSDTLSGGAGNDQFDGNLGNDDIVGGADNDALGGNQGLDALTGGTGDDTLTGGADDDRFVFFVGDGLDVITDFTAGDSSGEFIELRGFGFANFAQLQPLMSQQGTDVLISFDAASQVRLQNVALTTLNQNDFVFL
jgi:Ca2+-binding RTX toxin-like protein